jgi:hypothetical protein
MPPKMSTVYEVNSPDEMNSPDLHFHGLKGKELP